ncbi:unnamed protein product [Adineta steineri]|uniref:Centrosomal protein of 70 kDa n=1 Tax=Adineta steineri TaxID=433720 RepID=A0A815QKX3_9BILA|nr:unnamed protein product [Adineta steineri]CAF1465350.1 unnamed protein product [Adineta steineri]
MRSTDNYYQQRNAGVIASKRRLPFDSASARMSSSTVTKRAVSNTLRYPQSNNRHEIFLNKSSSSSSSPSASSSITEHEDDDEVKMLDETIPENDFHEADKRKKTITNSRHSAMNNHNSKTDIGGPLIQELLQSNMNLKKEIRDIRRQIKYNNNGSNKQRIDRVINTTSPSNKTKILKDHNNDDDDDDECSFAPVEHDYYNNSSKSKQYKTEATMYKQQLEKCQDTIVHLRKTIHSMEKRIEQLRSTEHRQVGNASNQHESHVSTSNNNTDHRFIHELFHLCIKYLPRSSKLKTTVPTHQDMKTFIRQTFTDLIQRPSTKISAIRNHDSGHFICKCSERSQTEHRPSYQYCLTLIEQCQSLFDITCYTQLSTALNELYYRHGELANFKRSIASTLGVTESTRLVSCPKLIKKLQQVLDDAKSNELITFKKMAKINDMNEAVSKIRSYDDFVPYYHQFIEQMANLLVSKGDEIMPAIKTLKLLAHSDSYRSNHNYQQSHSLPRASSLITSKNSYENNLSQSKSLRLLSSKSNNDLSNENNKLIDLEKQQTNDSEQKHDEDSQ